jgi:nucleotide-binding universal stress UspA family protein
MFPFRKILFPVDYSAPCEAVVPHVKEMVRHFSADLTLVHAYGPEALAFSELAITDPDLPDEARTHEQQRLREFALKTFPGQHVETITQLGEAGTVLHGIVQHQSTDLVMLPTHGRGPIRRFLLGSVAAKVLHDIGAAVWTGVGAALIDHAPRMPYESILCALDDSDEAQGVLKAAAAFADNYRAQLWLVQVVQMPPVTMEIDFSPYKKDLIDASEDRLQELKAQLGINALHTVIEGAVADGVRQEAVRRRADLIITGRGHAQAAVGRIWSNVYPIVREAPCPVLSL